MTDILNYYKSQSEITNPGRFSGIFDDIPLDIDIICEKIQGILLHINDGALFGYKIPNSRKFEMSLREVEALLTHLFSLNSSPITKIREPNQRVITTCRDFSVLACSILRSKGIPARVRYGFSRYYFTQFFHDIVLLEYWNFSKNRWILVDARTTEKQIAGHHFTVDFNMHIIPSEQFISSAKAWKMCRSKEMKATWFGTGPRREIKGLWYIRNKLIQDLASLNKKEMLLWDLWGYIAKNRYGLDPYDEEEIKIIDQVAEIIDCKHINLNDLNKIYHQPELRVSSC